MKRIGIFGGTFDPPHIGHTKIAKAALEQFNLSEVRFMTGGIPPHKRNSDITPPIKRLELTRLAVAGEQNMVADDFEVLKKTYSYTAETLTELKKLHPEWEVYFIIVEDSLRDFHLWYRPEIIVENCILLVYPRGTDSDIAELIEKRRKEFDADIRLIDAPIFNISSTMIRNGIKAGESMDEFMDEAVREYIKRNGLYL